MCKKSNQLYMYTVILIIAVFCDRYTKLIATDRLKDKTPYIIIHGVFEFLYSENRGAAFGILQGKQIFFFVISAVVLAVLAYIIWKLPAKRRFFPLGISLVLICSGAVGNMIDRISQGYVVDFLYFKLINFPIFNVADCYVTIGTASLIILLLFFYKDEELSFIKYKKEV